MNFTEYLTQAAQHNTLTIDSGWGQGRTTFGGLSAALLLHKIQPQLSDDDMLRSLSVNFCGPLMTETECELSTQELRSGKSVSHFQGQVTQCNPPEKSQQLFIENSIKINSRSFLCVNQNSLIARYWQS